MLTPKQKLFVQEYLLDQNAAAAARRAGYSSKNSDKIGHQLLGKTRVSEEIKFAMKNRVDQIDLKSETILKAVVSIAFFDISSVITINDDNQLKILSFNKMDKNSQTAIKSISQGKHGLNIQFHDKLEALKLLGEHFGMWTKSKQSLHEEQSKNRLLAIERLQKYLQVRLGQSETK